MCNDSPHFVLQLALFLEENSSLKELKAIFDQHKVTAFKIKRIQEISISGILETRGQGEKRALKRELQEPLSQDTQL